MIHESICLKYEPSSEPLHIYVKKLFSNSRAVSLVLTDFSRVSVLGVLYSKNLSTLGPEPGKEPGLTRFVTPNGLGQSSGWCVDGLVIYVYLYSG